jgi:hypothetical protein
MTGVVPIAVAALVLATPVLAAYGIARAIDRRARRQRRAAIEALAAQVEAFLAARLEPRVLRRAAARAAPEILWSALEKRSLVPRRERLVALSVALAGIPHTRRERRALSDDSPWRRELAARRLALIEEPASRRALRAALEAGPVGVTFAAALALGAYRDARSLRWLIAHPEAIITRPPKVRSRVLRAFGRGALPALSEALERGGHDPALERAMIEALTAGGATRVGTAIAARLASPDLELRIAAARALGRLPAAEAAPALIAALADAAWQVRAAAARSLGRLRTPAAIAPLAARLTDPAWWVRRHSAYALRAIGEDGRAALRRIAEGSPDPYARDIAREALGSGERLGAA